MVKKFVIWVYRFAYAKLGVGVVYEFVYLVSDVVVCGLDVVLYFVY